MAGHSFGPIHLRGRVNNLNAPVRPGGGGRAARGDVRLPRDRALRVVRCAYSGWQGVRQPSSHIRWSEGGDGTVFVNSSVSFLLDFLACERSMVVAVSRDAASLRSEFGAAVAAMNAVDVDALRRDCYWADRMGEFWADHDPACAGARTPRRRLRRVSAHRSRALARKASRAGIRRPAGTRRFTNHSRGAQALGVALEEQVPRWLCPLTSPRPLSTKSVCQPSGVHRWQAVVRSVSRTGLCRRRLGLWSRWRS